MCITQQITINEHDAVCEIMIEPTYLLVEEKIFVAKDHEKFKLYLFF